ncbi:unnamed protein product [Urochloa humidicola]
MQVLKLNQNSLNGTIPDTLTNCSNLKELHLYTNFLEGAIPREIGFLKNLVFLGLAYNNLIGTIPPTVGNITHLEKLYLGYNQLEGRIPDELGQLSNISIMDLPQNKLSGSIPESLFNLSSLKTLGLNINQLSKSLPNDVGDRLSSLQQLFLGYNMLEGHIPDSLGNASMLRQVSLESNNLTGQIPSSLGRLSRLFFLNLQKNMLEAKDSESWEFLQALGNCSALQKLQLAGNQLQGLIPISVGNLPASLEHLILGGNNLSGVVPPSIGNLSALIELSLDQGSLTGNIGHWIANLNRLQGLYLSNNSFSGPIPASIGTLTNLSELFLGNNDFDSPIPQSLWDLRALQKLSVSYNNLQGNISPEIGNLKQLRNLDLSSNKLSGEIPDTLGQCTDLTDVQMNQNLLAGSIPASFGKLESLSLLNLSHNTLSGTIPTSLGDLLQLRELDLSYNHLQGQIPINGIFKNATAVSLEKNWGLCGEVGDLGVPSCPSISRKISRQYYLVRILIPIFGFMSLLLLIYFLILEKKMPRRKNLELASFGEYFLKVSYNDLAQATKNFAESNLIGRGSCGSVYKGTIKESKIEVAVKVFNLEMRGAERSFMAECEALRSIQHRNLLPIITACSTVDSTGNVFKALVYEFMPNGSLDSWLHHHKGDGNATKRLGLTKTISIAANIADALDYLHHDCGRPTVHCDVKPSNILLDEEMDALLGDFGIARFYADSRLTSPGSISSIGVKGTIGYIAPEYAQGGHVSTSADAYSFGIVLLEMMTGKRPTDPMFVDGFNLVNFVESNFPHQIHHIIDAHLKEECNNEFAQANMVPENVTHQCLASLLQVALSCAHPLPSERANMKEAASKIHAIKTTHLGWKSKK